ncbi:ABC transporter permease [Amycolatopsis panacis]|uniref:Autoinducer 2 import system permease protein LsrD n=1 Tax=Amycolatopsis panacis TaxID=2340917 RepID=A0A419I2C5_9PSEU|nr:ABC transporter permease [Amycolatopsis panacis]RJQ84004.1 ABC transporter permease [Amycolatopsis panacis]
MTARSDTRDAANLASAPTVETPTGSRSRRMLQAFGIYAVLVGVVAAATIAYHGFLTWDNIKIMLTQNAPLGIVAVGMTLVIIAGGFDLSVGSVYAASGTIAAGLSIHGSVLVGMIAGVAAGVFAGLINGFVVAKLNINPFIATLGSSTVFSGIILLITNSQPYTVDKASFADLGQSTIAGIPLPLLFVVVTFVIGWIVLNRTIVGRQLLSVGGNREASRLAGIRTTVVVGGAYVVSGTLAGFAGVVSASQLGVGQGGLGTNLALEAIAIVVIGGTSLLGGEGSVVRTAVGLLIIASLNNLFFSLAFDSNWQSIAQGLIIIVAVGFDQLMRKRSR